MKNMKSIAIALVLSATLAACGQPNYPQQVPQLDQATGQPIPQAGNDGYGAGTVAAAALGGAVLGNMMGKRSAAQQQAPIIVNQHPGYGYNRGYNRGYGRQTVTTTTVKKSMFGNKTVTRTVTKRRR